MRAAGYDQINFDGAKPCRYNKAMQRPLLLVHGVPDTPHVWAPLVDALKPHRERIIVPALPGFTTPAPADFPATKDAYAAWLVDEIQALYNTSGPIDIVGHDWGALLTLRAASLVPQYIRSWAVSGAVIDPDYSGHKIARIWATPVMGELAMALSTKTAIEKSLCENGLPPAVARIEAQSWSRSMRKCILKLYRSAYALRFDGPWASDLSSLPAPGFVLWGENDPYVDTSFATRFAEARKVACHVEPDTGHWLIAERPDLAAQLLNEFWKTQR